MFLWYILNSIDKRKKCLLSVYNNMVQETMISKATKFPTVFFVGLPALVFSGIFLYRLGNGENLQREVLYMIMGFIYVSLAVYVYYALDNNEYRQINIAGIWGYSTVVLMVIIQLVLAALAERKTAAANVAHLTSTL
jgi:high-affinity Fe2+/Pb2+ permease